jgi:hypothetical protein
LLFHTDQFGRQSNSLQAADRNLLVVIGFRAASSFWKDPRAAGRLLGGGGVHSSFLLAPALHRFSPFPA